MSGILDAYGNTWTRVCEDASWKKLKKGDVVANFQWFTNEAMGLTNEPAILFTCPARSKGQNVAIITNREVHRYVLPGGGDRAKTDDRAIMTKAFQIAGALGLDPFSRTDIFSVCDLIYQGLQELQMMPPKPSGMRNDGSATKSIGTAEIVQDGKVISSQEVMQ
jgi:hypothetical protein